MSSTTSQHHETPRSSLHGSAEGTHKALFWACFIALVATSFVFGVRSTLIGDIAKEFALSEAAKGRILGVGLWPFALSIVFCSLIIDRIAFINPVVATLFSKEKSKWLNILHAGWPPRRWPWQQAAIRSRQGVRCSS